MGAGFTLWLTIWQAYSCTMTSDENITDRDDWLSPHLSWITVPSWLVSLALHLLTSALLVVVSRLPGCQPDMAGDDGESFQTVGLYVRPSVEMRDQPQEQPAADHQAAAAATAVNLAAPAPQPVPDQPPIPLQLPTLAAPTIVGLGGRPLLSRNSESLLSPGRTSGASASSAGAGGGESEATTFMGIKDTGRRFVYAIDSSSSMTDFGAFRVAKSELLASLERLTETQQFQVLFCDSNVARPLNAGRLEMFYGTDSQRLEVRLQVAGIGTDAGTNHKQAILTALSMNPDVIFFLSDGGEPFLTARDLDEIRRRNRGSTRIHCIEFGRGPVSLHDGQPVSNFLTKLAAQNDGRYAYRDVTQFLGR